MGDNRKADSLLLFLANFIVASQIVVLPLAYLANQNSVDSWITKGFLLALTLSSFIFLLFFNIFSRLQEAKKILQAGLFSLSLGSLIGFLASNSDLVTLGRVFAGVGSGMIILSQLGMIWQIEKKEARNVFLVLSLGFLLGAGVSPRLIRFLSGPNLNELKTFLILGTVLPLGVNLELSRVGERLVSKIISLLTGGKKKVAIWGIGYLGNAIIVYGFDYFLYPFVIWKWGVLKGSVVMTFLSFLICWLTIIFYDWAKQDWLGIETIKSVKEYDGKSWVGKITSWIMKKGNGVILVFLSIKFDPFITTAYMRQGAHEYNGLSRRDWTIFLASLVIGNAYWTAIAFTGVSVIEYVGRGWF